MAQKRRFLDVWITEGNTVYREVPFAVVTDWIQQGRLLGDDKLRPSGTAEWFPIGGSPAFAAYMPKMEEHRAEDQAEALEPMEVDFTWKRGEEDDDDIDMIPLIDVSLVLLIFFMMTATVASDVFKIDTPEAKNKVVELSKDMKLWVGIDSKSPDGGSINVNRPYYSFGDNDEILIQPTPDFNPFVRQLAARLDQELTQKGGKDVQGAEAKVKIRLRADQNLPIETVKKASVELKKIEATLSGTKFKKVTLLLFGQVSDPQQ